MKKMILCCAVLIGSMGSGVAHPANNAVVPIGRYGSLELTRKVLQGNDTGYIIAYDNATIHLPKMRLEELLDALQNLRSSAMVAQDIPLILHGGLQLQQIAVHGINYMRITDRKKKSTLLTPEQQDDLMVALQQEVAPDDSLSMN